MTELANLITNGILDTSDLINPTRPGTFLDDYYLGNLVAGELVQLNLDAGFDTYLQLVDASTGLVIAFNDDSNGTLNSQLSFTPQAGVDYILRVTSFGANVSGNYTLVTSAGALTAGIRLGNDQSLSGTLTATDPTSTQLPSSIYDGYFLSDLVAGQQVQLNLGSTAFDPYLQVVNANTGEVVAANDNFNGLNSQVIFTPQDGVDYIAQATSLNPQATGEYTLTTTTVNPLPPGPAAWTFMVYLSADNDLEGFGIEDFLEMAAIGSTNDINIVVQLDRSGEYDASNGDWTDTRRGIIQAGDTPDASWGTSIGEANMGEQSTLTSFIDWSMSNYQAENYAVVLWGHGGGWNVVAPDDPSSDYLTANEVSGALTDIPDPIDLIGADACLMAMVEFAYQVGDRASVLVGSEQLEPGYGWSYDTLLSDLAANSDWTGAELGVGIVDSYEALYNGPYSEETLSATDLAVVNGSLALTISTFATTFMSEATDYDIRQLSTYRDNAAYYYDTNFRDLGTILASVALDTTMTDRITVAAEAALGSYYSGIISNFSAASQDATGLSIYFQPQGFEVASNYNNSHSAFAAATTWDEFLNWWAASAA